ncbi:AAA-domain-containing protein [Plenodomus tracheiphilus IPT5]|uniref:AAA-domain-containing protein n=1 Tax=Plenodomus tracheiphilus IPT5 TaxID=1408161 RepID=A0A6A7BE84_9PLEO|nr:AAA-domain-containing protein [Plenodomus tracheiphilus IPT5]
MSAESAYALRPLERPPPSTPGDALEGAFRVHLSQKELKNLGLSSGDLVRLRTVDCFKGYAVAWLASQTNAGNKPIAKVSDFLRLHYDLELTDRVIIEKVTGSLKPLRSIEVSFSQPSDQLARFSSTEDLLFWVRHALVDLDIILPDCTFPLQPKGLNHTHKGKLRIVVHSIDPAPSEKHPVYFDPIITQVSTSAEIKPSPDAKGIRQVLRISPEGIGGLTPQIENINKNLFSMTHIQSIIPNKRLLGPTSFLLHGPEGTGKSLLLDRLANAPWQEVHRIDSETHQKNQARAISETFKAALEDQPSLILMDNLDKFLEKADTLVVRLRKELAKLEGTQVVVAAAARSVYDVDASLRTTSALKTEIEIFAPNVKQREDIFRQILGPDCEALDFPRLAERSHGFVGRDIYKLCGLARNRRLDHIYSSLGDGQKDTIGEVLEQSGLVTQDDFNAVIDQVQPTVLKDSILEVPKVNWSDIAGLDHVRALLEAITVRPFKYPDLDAKFGGPSSRKGVLMYGPPGCAKTLIAQAVATESNQNFLAVKGSELIKMYVGESERAIRDVFRRARAAKPCIIFFDEIDSIGKSREKTQDSGLNVVTTLLNEMDGIEALKDVFIIGATNRPDILDSALIRTGRFDAHIHIGLPTEEARRQILQIHTRKRPLASDVELETVAARTEGSSGADISGLCSVAIEMAMSDYEKDPTREPQIHMHHFERALAQHVPHTVKEEAERYENWRPGKSLSQD